MFDVPLLLGERLSASNTQPFGALPLLFLLLSDADHCDTDSHCADDLVCDTGGLLGIGVNQCSEKSEVGGSCEKDSHCVDDLYCSSDTGELEKCWAGEYEDSCSSDDQCQGDMYCISTTSVAKRCRDGRKNGAFMLVVLGCPGDSPIGKLRRGSLWVQKTSPKSSLTALVPPPPPPRLSTSLFSDTCESDSQCSDDLNCSGTGSFKSCIEGGNVVGTIVSIFKGW